MATITDDPRYSEIQAQKELAIASNESTTADLLSQNTNLTATTNAGLDEQQTIQEQAIDTATKAAIAQYENEIAKSETGYKTEAGAAYSDYQKLINPYGVQAETQAASGLLGSKVTESSRISAHNSYQERVATARSSFEEAKTEFEIAITEAQQSGDLQKAELAYEIYQQKAENALREFEYASSLRLSQEQTLLDIANTYYSQEQDLQSQVNYEEAYAYQQEQDLLAQQQWEKEHALSLASLEEEKRQANMTYASKEDDSIDISGSDTNSVYSNLDSQLSNMNIGTNSVSGIDTKRIMAEAMIQKNYEDGNITYDEAVALAEKYNL